MFICKFLLGIIPNKENMERRNTVQREIVLKAVYNLKNHPTAEEIYEVIRIDNPSISRGTVYRNLGILAAENMIRKISVPEGPGHYDHKCHKHYHAKCVKCGCVNDVVLPSLDIMNQVNGCENMKILDYDILFEGICSSCQKNYEIGGNLKWQNGYALFVVMYMKEMRHQKSASWYYRNGIITFV